MSQESSTAARAEEIRALADRLAHNATLPIPSTFACRDAAAALRAYAALLEEREAEERLLLQDWHLMISGKDPKTRLFVWRDKFNPHRWEGSTDRATAARLALEAING